MKIIFKAILLVIFSSATLFSGTIGLATGSTQGTYYYMGKNIKAVCGDSLNINVIKTQGSVDNIEKLLTSLSVQVGMAQSDALFAYDILNKGKKITKKIKSLYPLYNEQLHIITRKGENVRRFSDLDGKRVSVGSKGSGRNLTHTVLSNILGLKWVAKYSKSYLDDVVDLMNGKIDAILIVAGAPTSSLYAISRDISGLEKHIQLNSIDRETQLSNLYNRDVIPAGTYSFQDGTIYTYSVKSILITWQYSRGSSNYKNVEELFQCIDRELPILKKHGNPQWKEVKFTHDMGWPYNHEIVSKNK
jgi:TRAP transporter TAXI family solute receptor